MRDTAGSNLWVVDGTGRINRYDITTGGTGFQYGWTTFSGGGLAGQTVAANVPNIIGVRDIAGSNLWVVDGTGRINRYDITTGGSGAQYGWTTFTGGDYNGQSISANIGNIIGVRDISGSNLWTVSANGIQSYDITNGNLTNSFAWTDYPSSSWFDAMNYTNAYSLHQNSDGFGRMVGVRDGAGTNLWVLVPEPSSALMSVIGVSLLLVRRRRS